MSRAMSKLEICFAHVEAFKALVTYMYEFTKESVLMIISRKEIKLIYEEANRGKVFGTLKLRKHNNDLHSSVKSVIVNNDTLYNYFILKFNIECLNRALETIDGNQNIKMELKENGFESGNFILLFQGLVKDCYERSISKFFVTYLTNCDRINPPPSNRLPLKFDLSDLGKLLKMAELFINVKDNLLVSVQHTTDHHIFKVKYSLPTGSKVCHQIIYRRRDQANVRSLDAAAVKPRLFAKFFKLTALNIVTCCIKHDDSIWLEAENFNDDSISIKVYLKGLSEVVIN